jgi:ferric-chelate reductase
MAGPSTSASPAAAAAKAAASKLAALDKSLAKNRWHEYPNEFWFFCAAFIGLVAVFQFLSFLHTKLARAGRSSWKDIDAEKARAAPRPLGPISLSRIPVAAVNVFRVLAFRTSVGFGGYTLNLAEVAVTILYMGGLFTWTFVNCMESSLSYLLLLLSLNMKNLIGLLCLAISIVSHEINVTYWANRAGFLAASQFPLLAALGTKNNIISRMSSFQLN